MRPVPAVVVVVHVCEVLERLEGPRSVVVAARAVRALTPPPLRLVTVRLVVELWLEAVVVLTVVPAGLVDLFRPLLRVLVLPAEVV